MLRVLKESTTRFSLYPEPFFTAFRAFTVPLIVVAKILHIAFTKGALHKIIAGTILIHIEVSRLINRMFFANNSIVYKQL